MRLSVSTPVISDVLEPTEWVTKGRRRVEGPVPVTPLTI